VLIKELNSNIKKFEKIIHIADIHIRLTKRHDEYLEIFSKLYSDIKNTPENTCVCILGDLLHSKSDLSPECVQVTSDFLKNLADLRNVVLIPGNHDATLNNKNRLDSLSPIVNALKHPSLFYFKETGIYILGNILFNHMSVFDSYENYIKASDIPKVYLKNIDYKIALFHGAVNSAITDMGHQVENRSITTRMFDGHDMVLLGDIHKFQRIDLEKEVDESELEGYLNSGDWEVVYKNYVD